MPNDPNSHPAFAIAQRVTADSSVAAIDQAREPSQSATTKASGQAMDGDAFITRIDLRDRGRIDMNGVAGGGNHLSPSLAPGGCAFAHWAAQPRAGTRREGDRP